MSNAPESLIGQVIAERYLVRSQLGEGGMGRVYLAEHVRMGRNCALKVINPALATAADAISRFNREAGNACKINHPNVAQVYDFGETPDGMLYLAMEYIEGETLEAMITRGGPLPPQRAIAITSQIAAALAAAHHLGIVHRDLKPENVMVGRHLDGSDWVKVVDFGIAKTMQQTGHPSQTVTTAGVSLGTPEYMSPEQLAGEPLDHRTDIYSLGLVLFHMLTGELPYPHVTSKEALVRRLVARPRTLAEVRPGQRWPAALQRVLDLALAPEAVDRFASVADLGRAVAAALTAAPNEGPTSRAPWRTKQLLLALAAILIIGIPAAYALVVRPMQATPSVPASPPPPHQPAADTTRKLEAPPPVQQQGTASPVDSATHVVSSPAPHTTHHHIVATKRKPSPPKKDDVIATSPPPAPTPAADERSARAANDIRAHIERMKQRFESGDPRGAREEFGMAASALPILRDLDPDPEHVAVLQRELAQGVRELVAICYRKRADSTLAPGIRCENMRASLGRFREGGQRR